MKRFFVNDLIYFTIFSGFFFFCEQGAFLCTRRAFFSQKIAWKVRQLPVPSRPFSSGHLAYRQMRSQNSIRGHSSFFLFVSFPPERVQRISVVIAVALKYEDTGQQTLSFRGHYLKLE
jgi:hypothetical protein